MPPWNAPKAKVQLRLSVQRLKTLQQKKEAQAKASRREIAELIERAKFETARIKVESLIHEDVYTELLEVLELYCELLLARFGLLDQNTREPDPGIKESVCSILHAAPRTELKELHVLRDILIQKYGREFLTAAMENQASCVSDRVVRKLNLSTPSPELVDAYLGEIAKAYGVEWEPPEKNLQEGEGKAGGGIKESMTESEDQKEKEMKPQPQAKLPSTRSPLVDGDVGKDDVTKPLRAAAAQPPSEDDFEALTRRFAALKKR